MKKTNINTIKRTYIPAVAVLLFSIVMSIIICALQASNEAKLRNYEKDYRAIPITVTVRGITSEDGTGYRLSPWTIDLFTGKNPVELVDASVEGDGKEPISVSFAEYVEDVRIKMSRGITRINGMPALDQITRKNPSLIGITSIPSDEQLLPEHGCEIMWLEGYDESVFGGEELVCLVPESKADDYDNGVGAAELYFLLSTVKKEGDAFVEVSRHEYECTLKIVGTYTASDVMSIYCPFSIIEQVYSGMHEYPNVDSISATIVDNLLLDEFREKASYFFSNLSENTEDVYDGLSVRNRSYTYTLAPNVNTLDINDGDLLDFLDMLEDNRIKFNRTVTVLVVVMSVAAGFLAGFFMIHRRKRDIMLMRTVDKFPTRVYFGLVFVQIVSIILGIIIGGAYYRWTPIDTLLTFAIVYFVVLALTLLLFMSKKLPKALKEDETIAF